MSRKHCRPPDQAETVSSSFETQTARMEAEESSVKAAVATSPDESARKDDSVHIKSEDISVGPQPDAVNINSDGMQVEAEVKSQIDSSGLQPNMENEVKSEEIHHSEKVNIKDGADSLIEVEEGAKPLDAAAADDADDNGTNDDDMRIDGINDGEEERTEVKTSSPVAGTEVHPRDSGFTSENFKIEITELPRKIGFVQLKKRLSTTLGLQPHKAKMFPNKPFAFVCFSCEEDRDQALQVINGHVWKGRTLSAKKARPSADPMKRKHDGSGAGSDNAKTAKPDNDLPATTRLRSSVEPLWEVPYEEQLQHKADKAKEALRSVASHPEVRCQFTKARKENEGLCCPLLPIIPSPVLEAYRNKAEFSVGHSEDGNESVVGFRFGLYRDGTDCVGSPAEISIISADSRKVVECFQKYVRQSKYPLFDHRTHGGHWRQLTVRTSRDGGGTMAIVEFVVNNTRQDQMEEEKESIHKYFTEGEGKEANVSTFFFRPCTPKTSNSTSEEPYELIYGDGYIHETLMGMKFRISANAFFQVNTAAAEVLYKMIAEWCQATPSTTILDICCGTGTIGLSMAKNVSKIIGIEMCKEAVEDAKVNAQLNGITHVKYHCAKVENVISDLTHNIGTNCVAVLDPPRGGVHSSVIKSLRSCSHLMRIVYAACNVAGAKQNFIDLCRPTSRKTKGDPFKFVRAVPIDMFPSTNHFEVLVLLERDIRGANSASTGTA